jgi:DnaK suppressor protein
MEPAELKHFKRILHDLLESTEQPLRRRDEIAVENAPDTLDRVQRAAERELAIRQIESDFSRLQSMKVALDRIEDGTYGTCLRCDGEIGIKRLSAVPWAACCVRCQEIVDRERKEPAGESFLPAMNISDVA